MDLSAPSPPKARRPERVPVSEELKRNYQRDKERFEEEKFASLNSFPTKLLGWTLIASVGFEAVGAFTKAHYDFGGLVFFFIGIGVLKGSQAALRLATFFIAPAAVLGILHIIWRVGLNEPLEIGREWVDYRDFKFWTLGISPCMYFLAEAIVAACAFRLRKIPFWTRTVRIWAAVIGVLMILQFGSTVKDLIRQREVRRSLSKEIATARAHLSTYGGGISSRSTRAAEQLFGELPNVLRMDWKSSPNTMTGIYRRNSQDILPSGQRVEHQEYLKLPSGTWGRIDMEVTLPEKP